MKNSRWYSLRILTISTVLFSTIAPSLYAQEQSRVEQAASIVREYAGRANQAAQKVARCTLGLEGCTQEEITQARILTGVVAAAMAVLSGTLYVKRYGIPGRGRGPIVPPTSPEEELQSVPQEEAAPMPTPEQQQSAWQTQFFGKPQLTEEQKRLRQQESMARIRERETVQERAAKQRQEQEFKKQQEASLQRQYALEEDIRRKEAFQKQQEELRLKQKQEKKAAYEAYETALEEEESGWGLPSWLQWGSKQQ